MRKIILTVFTVIFAVIFLVSAGFLLDYFIKSRKQKSQYDDLSSLVQQVQQQQQKPDANEGNSGSQENLPEAPKYVDAVDSIGNPIKILREYAAIYEKNSDMVGWIRIDGTKIDYPVVQSREWVNFYLTRNFFKETSKHGAIYLNEMADPRIPSDNQTIYGHRMADGSMFAALHDYKSKKFYDSHSLITFDTLSEYHTYKIFAVFTTTASVEDGFQYHEFVDGTAIEFEEYVQKCKELSLYDTGVDVAYGDKLITLSTCEHAFENGRLVVVAKRIT